MKDEEIDDLLMKAAQAPDDLKPEMLQRIADSIKPSIRPVASVAVKLVDDGRTCPGQRGSLSIGSRPCGFFRIPEDGYFAAFSDLFCARVPCMAGGESVRF